MSNLVINCPHCDRPTPVQLGKRVTSKQRCRHCGLIVGESDIVVGGRKPVVRKRVHVGGRQFGGETNLDEGEAAGDEPMRKRRLRVSHVVATVFVVSVGLGVVGKVMLSSHEKRKIEHKALMERYKEIEDSYVRNDAKDFTPDRPVSTMINPETIVAATRNLKDLMKCTKPEELLAFVRNADEVAPRLLEFYKQGRGRLPVSDWLVASGDMRIDYDDSLDIAIFYATTDDGEPWWVVFEETADGPKLDWDSFVRYSDMDVDTFLSGKIQEPKEFRLLAMIDDYFNYEYSNPADYWCVRLFDTRESFIFYGYVRKDSALGRRIPEEIPPKRIIVEDLAVTQGIPTDIDGINPVEAKVPGLEKPRSLVTVKLRFPTPPQGDNQVEITELVRKSWYIP